MFVVCLFYLLSARNENYVCFSFYGWRFYMKKEYNHHVDRVARKLAEQISADGFPDDLLTTPRCADALGTCAGWLQIGRMRSRPYGPPWSKLGCHVVYKRADLVAWLRERAELWNARQEGKPTAPRDSVRVLV